MRELEGHVDARFRPVADVFLDGFETGRDVGACMAVFIDGHPVVDIWHGHADRRRDRPWSRDTLVCMFSVTKAMTTVCLLQAADRGLVDLDSAVASYWPEFAGQGKADITVRHLLCHQSGLVGFHEPMDAAILYDWTRCVAALAAETPWWEPGTRHGYHARTFGYLLGEVLRRCTGETVGSWFRSEVAGPLELDFAIGLPESDISRCAQMLPARIRPGDAAKLPPGIREMMRDLSDPSTPTGAAFQNPSLGAGYMNSADFRRAEMPAANGHGTARAAAAMYDGLHRLLPRDIIEAATTTHSLGPDAVLKSITHFGLGFMLYHDESPIGLKPDTFGHAGAGGSMAFRDPEAGLSFCFAMNQMEMGVVTGGTSASRCATTVYECL